MTFSNKVVIIQLRGGLGNQLFQYAAARRLAYERDAILKLDISNFNIDKLREYKLNKFCVIQNIASDLETLQFRTNKVPFRLVRIIKKILFPYFKSNIYFEKARYKFEEKFLETNNFVYLKGYFQNEMYFQPIEAIIRDEFCLSDTPSLFSQNVAKIIETVNSVSLHIRRGDYATDSKIRSDRGLLPLSYYEKAVKYIVEKVAHPHFFVFSDDLSWVKENLHLQQPIYWVDVNNGQKDYEDLWLMSQCQHHIIANSSFSWWGAWLSHYPDKIVIAPKQWVLNTKVDTNDVIPKSWNRI
jgi:hypothetical protein